MFTLFADVSVSVHHIKQV